MFSPFVVSEVVSKSLGTKHSADLLSEPKMAFFLSWNSSEAVIVTILVCVMVTVTVVCVSSQKMVSYWSGYLAYSCVLSVVSFGVARSSL